MRAQLSHEKANGSYLILIKPIKRFGFYLFAKLEN